MGRLWHRKVGEGWAKSLLLACLWFSEIPFRRCGTSYVHSAPLPCGLTRRRGRSGFDAPLVGGRLRGHRGGRRGHGVQ
jgi:hypothetical protein